MKQSSEVKKGKDVATVVAPSVATVKNASFVKLLHLGIKISPD